MESLLGEVGKDEAGSVNVGVVVAAVLVLFLLAPAAQGLLDIAAGILAADHEADLTGGVGGNGGVSVLGDGEDFLAVSLELGDERQVKPLVLSCFVNYSQYITSSKTRTQRYNAETTVIIKHKTCNSGLPEAELGKAALASGSP